MPRSTAQLVAAVAAAGSIASCTGVIGETDPRDLVQDCTQLDSAAPDAPVVEFPSAGTVVVPDNFALRASAMSDVDGDQHRETEAEIWLSAAGEPLERVWTAVHTGPGSLTELSLADGQFEAGYSELSEWTEYVVRVRYVDDGECSFGEWSEYSRFRTDDGSARLFESGIVFSIELQIPPDSWDAIDAEAKPDDIGNYQRSYYPGTVRFADQVFDGAGLRVKGRHGSARRLSKKAAFKAHLSWDDPNVPGCPLERRLYGLKRLTLNNMVQDASFIHERLAYHFYGLLGVPTLRAAPIRVLVNGDYWGLYLNLETIDRRMLAREFASNRGMMFEGSYDSCDVTTAKVPSGEGANCFTKEFEPDECSPPQPGDDPASFAMLRELAASIEAIPPGEFYSQIQELLEFDDFLSLWAADVLMSNWDDYIYGLNNFRVYHDPSTGRWSFIQTGIDQTFVPHGGVSAFSPASSIARRCVQEPDCEAAFAARLEQAITVFEEAELDVRARAWEAEIEDHVADDPRKEVTNSQFHGAVDAAVDFIRSRPAQVRQELRNRGY